MDRDQLQKFAQYLIASHPNRVLASAQQLADRLMEEDSQMNKTSGEFLVCAEAKIPLIWHPH